MSGAPGAQADAIIWTRAMNASSIAEYFVEPGRVTLELELGLGDLEVFRNLLPDEVYERLGHAPRPLAERLPDFFQRDFVITTELGDPLPGQLLEIGLQTRIRRDEITGEPHGENPKAWEAWWREEGR